MSHLTLWAAYGPQLALFLFLSFYSLPAIGQQPIDKQKAKLLDQPFVNNVQFNKELQSPSLISLEKTYLKSNFINSQELLSTLFEIDANQETIKPLNRSTMGHNLEIESFNQVFYGIKVEHGQFKIAYEEGVPILITAERYTPDVLKYKRPTLSPFQAKEKAIDFINADVYAWDLIAKTIQESQLRGVSINEDQLRQEVDPAAELVWIDDYSTPEVDIDLAYKFNIYAMEPLSRDYVYVHVHTGKIMLKNSIIKHGTGVTRYNGTRTFPTTSTGMGTFELLGTDPVSGVELETRSLDGIGGLPLSVGAVYDIAVAIEDNDDDWTYAEHHPDEFSATCPYGAAAQMNDPLTCNEAYNDDVALDAHWGAGVVAQYWKARHNRNSYDDEGAKIFSFVHYGDAYDNAFWNGSFMTYGDGSYQGGVVNAPGAGTGFAPLSSMDVCAHEIGHAICTFTSDLVYQRESGAMNEGFSDIWGAAVENYVLNEIDNTLPYDPWGIGEQIDENDGGLAPGSANSTALRWMDDPKAEGNPDTYGGVNWSEPECGEPTLANDQCGVHNNSGVLNKWFYLLVEGSGQNFSPGMGKAAMDDSMNDNSEAYNVAGLGYEKAELITFLGEVLLTSNAKFIDMRNASIAAARILYSVCGPEEISVTNAWHGVGVGDAFVPCSKFIAFNTELNEQVANQFENQGGPGCSEHTFEVSMISFDETETANLSFGGTATLGTDYTVSTQSLSFSGTEIKSFEITIFNDGKEEPTENIEITFVAGGYLGQFEISIADEDFTPTLGGTSGQVLLTEAFPGDTLPGGWSTRDLFAESQVSWYFNAATVEMEGAYVSDDANQNTPQYTSNNVDGHTLLLSPPLDARGFKNVTVNFDWWAGGEYDMTTVYDFGSFVISFDNGKTFEELEQFYGPDLGQMDNGTYQMALSQLDNKIFKLGWKWYNDVLVFGSYSFAIDDVLVTADPTEIEVEVADTGSERVPDSSPVSFLASADGDLICSIQSVGGDLGCVTTSVHANDAINDTAPFIAGSLRSSKVFKIDPESQENGYEVTLFFTADEVDDWMLNLADLNLIYNGSDNIDDDSAPIGIILANDIVVNDQLVASGYISFTATIPKGTYTMALSNLDCIEDLTLNNDPLSDGTYNATTINSAGHILSTGDVGFIANEIFLNDQFIVDENGQLIVTIGGCPE